jgi:hypothetical protein
MRPPALALASFLFPLALAACGIAPRGAAKAQETASDLNLNARFGRMELAAEAISPKARQEFFERRRQWGGKIRIADSELTSLRITAQDEAEVLVRVAWYRVDEEELHSTSIRQTWHQHLEDWKLAAESRADGDTGLFGEAVVAAPDAPRARGKAHFPTIHLTGRAPDPTPADEHE